MEQEYINKFCYRDCLTELNNIVNNNKIPVLFLKASKKSAINENAEKNILNLNINNNIKIITINNSDHIIHDSNSLSFYNNLIKFIKE
jgi:esterase/lipase